MMGLLVRLKTPHSCIAFSVPPKLLVLSDEKDAMAFMVKELAIEKPAARAPAIAMDVWKHFEEKNAGKLDIFLLMN